MSQRKRSKKVGRRSADATASEVGSSGDGDSDVGSHEERRDDSAMRVAPDRPRKIKRNKPLLVVSCVFLLIWFSMLVVLAWIA